MKRRNLWIGIAGIALIAILAAGWYLGSPLFIDNTVDEAFPVNLPTLAEAEAMDSAELEATLLTVMDDVDSLDDADMPVVQERVEQLAALMPDKEMDDAMPDSAEPTILAQAQFVGADALHQGSGTATIYELADGSRILRFEEFDVTNGPDLHVLLATNSAPTSRDDIGDYIDLGSLKGNVGNQNYDIPADVDLSQFGRIVIYCQPFHVVFATATVGG